MTTNVLDFRSGEIPDDAPPGTSMPEGATSFDPEFPGSTEEAPYGYKPDGTPYKRRPNGGGRPKGSGIKGKGNESNARAAANMLCMMNNMLGVSLSMFGLPLTGAAIADANAQFEVMAIEALRTDPALCRKIMSAGATTGKTQLILAYGYLGMSAFPAMREEYAARRSEAINAD